MRSESRLLEFQPRDYVGESALATALHTLPQSYFPSVKLHDIPLHIRSHRPLLSVDCNLITVKGPHFAKPP
jgi:hypothetical protein